MDFIASCSYLIKKGADLRRKNRAGKTPMDVAIMYKNFEIARLIEDYFSMELQIHRTVSVTDLTSA